MLGASRASLAQVREELTSVDGVEAIASDLLSIAGLLGRESVLREALADPGNDAAARSALAGSVFDGKASSGAVDVVKRAVALRWSRARDLVDALAVLGADAALIGAEAAGRIDTVQDEIFRFGRAVDSNGELQLALGDPASTPDSRAAIVTALLEGRSQPETLMLVEDALRNPRGRRIDQAIDDLVEQAAIRRRELVAEVRAAIALSTQQSERMAAALARIYGQAVQIQAVVDPSVVGGVSVRIGDEVIDGTTTHRLQQARRQLLGGQG